MMNALRDDARITATRSCQDCLVRRGCPLATDVGEATANPRHDTVKIPKGTVMRRFDPAEDPIYAVVSGLAYTATYSSSGEVIVSGVLGRGHSIGAEILVLPVLHPHIIGAITDLVLCRMTPADLLGLAEAEPSRLSHVYDGIQTNVRLMARHIWVMNAQRVSERVKRLLWVMRSYQYTESDRDVTLDITHEEIAFLLNTDRVSVSRALQKLSKEGYIKTGHSSLTVSASIAGIDLPIGA